MPTSLPNPKELLAGFTTGYDKTSNKLFERQLHNENFSNLYPANQHDSANRLLQYLRGTLDGSTTPPTMGEATKLRGVDTNRSYNLDLVGNG